MGDIKTELGSTEELIEIVRLCGTKGDPSILPYERAQISVEYININKLVPLAKYALTEKIAGAASIHARLKDNGIDTLNLSGLLTWWDARDKYVIAPPIVEFWEKEGYLLVDGLHRVCLARERGRSCINCVVIRAVTTPLVPLPSVWEDVIRCGAVPEASKKRNYRFADAASLRRAMPEIQDKVTDENYQYFLYRELDALGSAGIREARGDISTEGDSK